MFPTGLRIFERMGRGFDELPAENYTVGLTLQEAGRAAKIHAARVKQEFLLNATPAHSMSVARIGIARRLVSADEFEGFARATGFVTQAEREGWAWTWEGGWVKHGGLSWRAPFGGAADVRYREQRALLPVLQISWNDAAAFCEWRSSVDKARVRLPREAEYEAWARLKGASGVAEMQDTGEAPAFTADDFLEMLIGALAESGEYQPPGILWEWTGDWFDEYPGGPANREFGTTYKVLRGGSLMSCAVQRCREYRFRRCPTARSPFYGFRIAIEL